MKYIGAHVSASGGVENAPRNAAAIGATAFALFTKNQANGPHHHSPHSRLRPFVRSANVTDIRQRRFCHTIVTLLTSATPKMSRWRSLAHRSCTRCSVANSWDLTALTSTLAAT